MIGRDAAVLCAALVTACGGTPRAAAPPPSPPPRAAHVPRKTAPVAARTPPPPARAVMGPAPPPLAAGSGPRFDSVPGTSIRFTGGDGSSVEHAIVIQGAHGETDGVQSEYWYASRLFGRQGVDFKVKSQALLEHAGHSFDQLDIALASGESRVLVFDISDYFGKF